MAAPQPSAPIYVLERVDLEPPTGEPGLGFTELECASKKAYGCEEHGQELVDGVALYLRLGDPPLVTSSLAVRISDAALRRFDSELGPYQIRALYMEMVDPGKMVALGHILVAEHDLIVVSLGFKRECSRKRAISYFLVYDNVDASLSMVSELPDPYQGLLPLLAVPNRTIGGGGGCELLLTGRKLPPWQHRPVLFVLSFQGKDLWQMKGRCFPPIQEEFTATMAFSFQRKGFWADLAQGLVCCDLPLSTGGRAAGEFSFIGLPAGCKLDEDEAFKLTEQPENLTRTVGCGGGSIRFVCINCATEYEDYLVTMWTLQMPQRQWKEEWKFSAGELWEFNGFKEAGLPKALPEFPVVLPDGGISFVLTVRCRSFKDDVFVNHRCSVDVPNKRVMCHGQVHNYPSKAFVLPSSFFQRKHGSHKRKFGDCHPTA